MFFNCDQNTTPQEAMEVLRTMRAREEQRAVARRTGAGGGIAGRFAKPLLTRGFAGNPPSRFTCSRPLTRRPLRVHELVVSTVPVLAAAGEQQIAQSAHPN